MNQRLDRTPAALYARVSSDRQDVDLSVSAQLRALRDYADKNGFFISREYIDEAESGRVADRPEFRKMIEEGSKSDAPFNVILVWKFSRFTRKREHAVAFKSMLRRKGVKVVSITEHADDTPTGKLMEAIIESVDEFYSENLAQDVMRGMREAASRGFWVASTAPYGYVRVRVQDGPKKRPKLELDPARASVVRWMFRMAESGRSVLDITKTLNDEGVATATGKSWAKTMVHYVLTNETYTGTLVWGTNASDGAPPVRVEDAFPAIVSKREFRRVGELMRSKAPRKTHPRRAASSYLLSGLVKCRLCRTALTGQEAKSGKFAYYVCQSLIKRGKGSCRTPRLNSKRFERLIVDEIRGTILTEVNIRDLVKLVDEEMDGVAHEQRKKLESIQSGLAEVRRWLDRLFRAIETTDLDISDVAPRIREHKERERKLQDSAREVEATLAERRVRLDNMETITAFAQDMNSFLKGSELTERRAFIQSFVKEISVGPGKAIVRYHIPMPEDSELEGKDTGEVALPRPVLSTVRSGTPLQLVPLIVCIFPAGVGRSRDLRVCIAPSVGRLASFWSRSFIQVTTTMGFFMTTYSVREFKARASEILRELSEGEEVIITRRGKPCGRLTPVQLSVENKPSLSTLRGSATYLPDASYEDFLNVKTLWEPRVPSAAEQEHGDAG